jgi:hypothetical protein
VDTDTIKTSAIVFRLVERLGCSHTLWMDSFYNRPELAQFLKCKGTDYVGVLYTNRKIVPSSIKDKRLKTGEHCSQHSMDVGILSWQDKNRF